MPEHTKAPWEWRNVGKRWVLWGAHSDRPIVLDCYRGEMRCRENGIMVLLDPEHPDARLIAAAPALLEAAKAALTWIMTGDHTPDPGRAAPNFGVPASLRRAIALAEGGEARE